MTSSPRVVPGWRLVRGSPAKVVGIFFVVTG